MRSAKQTEYFEGLEVDYAYDLDVDVKRKRWELSDPGGQLVCWE